MDPSRIRVLLVDDEPDFLIATARALERRGFVVWCAGDADQALAQLKEEPFEVAVLDVKMPGMPGDELFLAIKTRWPHLPVLLLTGHGTLQQAFKTSKEGLFDYLTKPCDMEKLALRLKEAVASGKRHASLEHLTEADPDIHLLIVDDDTDYLQSLKSALQRRGLRVQTAISGTEALNALSHLVFDVVLLDLQLPGHEGTDLVEQIRSQFPLTELLVVTGHPTLATAMMAMRAGAFDYLVKPQEPDQILRRVRAAYLKRLARVEEARSRELEELIRSRGD